MAVGTEISGVVETGEITLVGDPAVEQVQLDDPRGRRRRRRRRRRGRDDVPTSNGKPHPAPAVSNVPGPDRPAAGRQKAAQHAG